MKNTATVLIVLLIGVALGRLVLVPAMDRQAKVDCLTLQKQALDREPYSHHTGTGFYITKAQASECDSANISVNAPVL